MFLLQLFQAQAAVAAEEAVAAVEAEVPHVAAAEEVSDAFPIF